MRLLVRGARGLALLALAGVAHVGHRVVAIELGARLPAAVEPLARGSEHHLAGVAEDERLAVHRARAVALVRLRARIAHVAAALVAVGALGVGDAAVLPVAVVVLHPVLRVALEHRLGVHAALVGALLLAGLAHVVRVVVAVVVAVTHVHAAGDVAAGDGLQLAVDADHRVLLVDAVGRPLRLAGIAGLRRLLLAGNDGDEGDGEQERDDVAEAHPVRIRRKTPAAGRAVHPGAARYASAAASSSNTLASSCPRAAARRLICSLPTMVRTRTAWRPNRPTKGPMTPLMIDSNPSSFRGGARRRSSRSLMPYGMPGKTGARRACPLGGRARP